MDRKIRYRTDGAPGWKSHVWVKLAGEAFYIVSRNPDGTCDVRLWQK